MKYHREAAQVVKIRNRSRLLDHHRGQTGSRSGNRIEHPQPDEGREV